MQQITSAKTSLNQVAAGLRLLIRELPEGSVVLDYGGGKFDAGKEFAKEHGIELLVYDPFNRSDEENQEAMRRLNDVQIISCNNVLNVLEDGVLEQEVKRLGWWSALRKIPVAVTVYEGDGSGVGKRTGPDKYQRNEKRHAYVPLLALHFRSVIQRGDVFFCENR